MPTWSEVEAHAHQEGFKIVIRIVKSNKKGEHFYFYHTNGEADKIFYAETGPIKFKQFITKNHSKIYGFIKARVWGYFLTQKGDWIQYNYIPEQYWDELPNIAAPREGEVDEEQLANDPQFIWVDPEPIPPEKSNPAAQTKTGLVFLSVRASPEEKRPSSAKKSLFSPDAKKALASPFRDVLPIVDITSDDDEERPKKGAPPGSRKSFQITPPSPPKALTEATASSSRPPSSASSEFYIPPSGKVASTPFRPPSAASSATSDPEYSWDPSRIANNTEMTANNGARPKNTRIGFLDSIGYRPPGLRQTDGDDGNRPQGPHVTFGAPVSGDNNGREQFKVRALQDVRVTKLGRLLAEIDNLQNAALRNSMQLQDGVPPIMVRGPKIQSPSPDLLDEELVRKLNEAMYECSVKCSDLLIQAQAAHIDKLYQEQDELAAEWTPTAEEAVAADRVKEIRLVKRKTYIPRERKEPIQFFVAPDRERYQRFILPNTNLSDAYHTGARQSGYESPDGSPSPRNRRWQERTPRKGGWRRSPSSDRYQGGARSGRDRGRASSQHRGWNNQRSRDHRSRDRFDDDDDRTPPHRHGSRRRDDNDDDSGDERDRRDRRGRSRSAAPLTPSKNRR